MDELEFKMVPIVEVEGRGRRIMWIVRGEAGAVTLSLMRMPDEAAEVLFDEDLIQLDDGFYMGIDLGYHHRFFDPEREYASLMVDCVALEGMPCYYEGTSLGGMELAKKWRDAGLDESVIKAVLTAAYRAEFFDG